MTSSGLTSSGTLTFDVSNFLTMHPSIITGAGFGLAHVLYSHMRRSGGSGLSRRKARKLSNRKRRRFVDNIIMHHKRLHDRNREIVVGNARLRALDRQKALKEKKSPTKQGLSLQHNRSYTTKYTKEISLKERAKALRSNTAAKRLRSQSRWASIMRMDESNSTDS